MANEILGVLPIPWHLAPIGQTSCDYGSPVTQNECAIAVAAILDVLESPNKKPAASMLITGSGGTCNDGSWGSVPWGSVPWGSVPLGCSSRLGSWKAYYKTSGENCNIQGGVHSLVCSGKADPCNALLQQFHHVDEELSGQGKWQGGSVTGVCRGWGTNKVGLGFSFFQQIDAIIERNASQHCICYLVSIPPLYGRT